MYIIRCSEASSRRLGVPIGSEQLWEEFHNWSISTGPKPNTRATGGKVANPNLETWVVVVGEDRQYDLQGFRLCVWRYEIAPDLKSSLRLCPSDWPPTLRLAHSANRCVFVPRIGLRLFAFDPFCEM